MPGYGGLCIHVRCAWIADMSWFRSDTPDGLANSSELLALHEAVNMIMDEEEALLNKHMSCIKRNAQLLTEESQLLAKVQGVDVVDYDIDGYVQRLDAVRTNTPTAPIPQPLVPSAPSTRGSGARRAHNDTTATGHCCD